MADEQKIDSEYDAYAELVAEKSPALFCDACVFYAIEPLHRHFVCPSCKLPTKCCEGAPLEV